MPKKTITSDFFTTISLRQAFLSVYLMSIGSYKLRYGKDRELFEEELLNYINNSSDSRPAVTTGKILSFYNGRNALYHALKMIGVKGTDEVVVNAYTCSVVVNAVIQTGAKIVYSDIEAATYSFDYEKLERSVSEDTKVLVLQHTFGKQARDYKKIIELAREKNIIVIEDCALSLGNKKEILGDFAIFSTGRDKVISSVTGGFLLINNKKYLDEGNTVGAVDLLSLQKSLKMPSRKLVFQNLMYNLIGYKSYKFYDFFKLGRMMMFLSRKLHFITEILTHKEKNFESDNFEGGFPNSLAYLARKELEKIDNYTKIRKRNAQYLKNNISNELLGAEDLLSLTDNQNYFRIPILLESEDKSKKLYNYMRENNILLGKSWTGTHIVPVGTDLRKAGYRQGSCSVAEDISKRILFLPTHVGVSVKDGERIVRLLNNFNEKNRENSPAVPTI